MGERQRAGEMTEVLASQRYNAHMVPEDGSLTCTEAGICKSYRVHWGRFPPHGGVNELTPLARLAPVCSYFQLSGWVWGSVQAPRYPRSQGHQLQVLDLRRGPQAWVQGLRGMVECRVRSPVDSVPGKTPQRTLQAK